MLEKNAKFTGMQDPRPSRKVYTTGQAKAKAEHYCAYQERSQQEVRDKLYSWGLHKGDVELVLSELIENNFLNEARFAHAYTSGKFKIKGWGKFKIEQGLRAKQVSDPLIRDALESIPEEAYKATLREILKKKERLLKESDPYLRQQKLIRHGLMRGYEVSLITELLSINGL